MQSAELSETGFSKRRPIPTGAEPRVDVDNGDNDDDDHNETFYDRLQERSLPQQEFHCR